MSEHPFFDPISGQIVDLIVNPEGVAYDGTTGVRHTGCPTLADVFPELDAFSCKDCRWSGRVSGVWFMEVWTWVNPPESGDQSDSESRSGAVPPTEQSDEQASPLPTPEADAHA